MFPRVDKKYGLCSGIELQSLWGRKVYTRHTQFGKIYMVAIDNGMIDPQLVQKKRMQNGMSNCLSCLREFPLFHFGSVVVYPSGFL